MKVPVKLDLTEDQLRRIRAAYGRGGVATRAEVRTWLDRVVQTALKAAPEPKRRRAVPPPERKTLAAAAIVGDRWEAVPVTDETVCRHCKRQRQSHGKMLLTCLPGFGAPVGSRFSPAAGG
jgi:molybdenum cofactor biosynthesis enzyme MoaA